MTIAERLAATGNRPSGFDYMRLALASGVVIQHTLITVYPLADAIAIWQGPLRPPLALVLPMFFALSGFLVSQSLARSRTVISYLGLRALRIFPALAVNILLAALVLGPLLTALPLGDYFANPLFRAYLHNIAGSIHYLLPGLFADHPSRAVNVSLWTIPWELFCYLGLALIALIGLNRLRTVFLLAVMALGAAMAALGAANPGVLMGRTAVPAPLLVECFLLGAAAWLFRDRIVPRTGLLVASALGCGLLMLHPLGDLFAAVPITYLTLHLGLLDPARRLPVSSGDYSYGIFLYGFPVQQLVYAVLGPHPWWLNFLAAAPVIVLLAIFSWHMVEAPVRHVRPWLYALEARLLTRAPWLGRRDPER